MLHTPHISFSLSQGTAASQARFAAINLAQKAGFDETEIGQVAIVATELATNLSKHAVNGELLLRSIGGEGAGEVEMLAIDRGPGSSTFREYLRDGYSTSGSPGTGLGAVIRLSSTFDVYSQPGKGTVLLARLRKKHHPVASDPVVDVGVVWLAKSGEVLSGDAWIAHQQADRCMVLIADGLGHGPDAARAAQAAIQVLERRSVLAPAAILNLAHDAMRATRGGAVGVAEINVTQQVVRFAGIGNITGVIAGPAGNQHLVSHNGIVGHNMRQVREFSYPWPEDSMLVLHSDGLGTRWDLDAYVGLKGRHAALIAGVLYRDFTRGRDDVTVLVVKPRTTRVQTRSPEHVEAER